LERVKGPQNIWVFGETAEQGLRDVALELASEGRIIADGLNEQLCVVVLNNHSDKINEILSEHGADIVYNIITSNCEDAGTHALASLICKYNPRLVLIGATLFGIDIASRISTRNTIDLFTNCLILSLHDRSYMKATKRIFEDNAYTTYQIPISEPHIITVIPGSFDPKQCSKRATEIIVEKIDQGQSDSRVKYLEVVRGDPQKIDISLAEVIVAFGRGSEGSPGTINQIEALAGLLGGSIGGSRPTVDNGWLPFERQIGQTGKTVSPKLLIALGISGAFEFVSGMKDSKLVIAVNKDPQAPIFRVANLSLVGNLHEIVSEIVSQLESRLEDEVS